MTPSSPRLSTRCAYRGAYTHTHTPKHTNTHIHTQVRVQGRALDTTERKIKNGDEISMQKIEQFQAHEAQDMKSVMQRAEALEEEINVIPKMTGPPGPRGPPGIRGPQVHIP